MSIYLYLSLYILYVYKFVTSVCLSVCLFYTQTVGPTPPNPFFIFIFLNRELPVGDICWLVFSDFRF